MIERTEQKLRAKLESIPELPGIYKMLDSRRNIIYIGKSKCLKKRVKSYFTGTPAWEKVNRMVSFIKDIEYIVTDTHLEARLLECELIKTHKPTFNSQMKNDQGYVYLKVESYNPYNPLSVVDEREEDCFGPFRRRFALGEFINALKNLYPINKVNHGYEFEFHLFPVTMEKEVFDLNRAVLLELLTEEARMQEFIGILQLKMEEAASAYRYETATIYRDLMQEFTYLKNGLNRYNTLMSRDILLKLPVPDGYKLFYITQNSILNSKKYSELSASAIREFLKYSKENKAYYKPLTMEEKISIDFRDVLYSEISALPENMIELL